MADRFDKFTERARRVLTYAREEAARLNHSHVGTEHILLGLMRDKDSVASTLLRNVGADPTKLRSAVELMIGKGPPASPGQGELTPGAKRVIELSVEEARRSGAPGIGTEHLLIGLVREGEGIASAVLESLGVTLDRLRASVLAVQGIDVSKVEFTYQLGGPPTDAALTCVAEAKAILERMSGSPIEKDLIQALVISRLEEIEAILNLPPRLLEANRREIEASLPALEECSTVLQRYESRDAGAALQRVCSSLHGLLS